MARNKPPPHPGWTLLGWLNLVAVSLLILLFTGIRPTLEQILIGTALFLLVGLLLLWGALREL
jgi:hypothetical protein